MCVCVWEGERRNAHEFWTGPKAGWNWLYPLTAQEDFFFPLSLSPYAKRDGAALLLPWSPCYNRDRENQIKPIWNPGMKWRKEPLFSQNKTQQKRGGKKSSWKIIQHGALHCVDPQCWDLCCRKCKNLENAVVMVVLISRGEMLQLARPYLLQFKSVAFSPEISIIQKPDDANAACNKICRQCYLTGGSASSLTPSQETHLRGAEWPISYI